MELNSHLLLFWILHGVKKASLIDSNILTTAQKKKGYYKDQIVF